MDICTDVHVYHMYVYICISIYRIIRGLKDAVDLKDLTLDIRTIDEEP